MTGVGRCGEVDLDIVSKSMNFFHGMEEIEMLRISFFSEYGESTSQNCGRFGYIFVSMGNPQAQVLGDTLQRYIGNGWIRNKLLE